MTTINPSIDTGRTWAHSRGRPGGPGDAGAAGRRLHHRARLGSVYHGVPSTDPPPGAGRVRRRRCRLQPRSALGDCMLNGPMLLVVTAGSPLGRP